LRLLPALAGSLSLFLLSASIFRLTDQRSAAVFGAAFLTVLPLHVYFSTQGIPDAIAVFCDAFNALINFDTTETWG